ncbi:MAG: sugar phosphate isomerase/epimerase [Mailhella sp.]|nr:sugar phosphate isomerase/epimerase [Mailhella sp.]
MKISISVASSPSNMRHIMFFNGLDKDLPRLAEMGFDGVDLFFPKPQEVDVSKVRRLVAQYGLNVTMLASQGDLMADGLYLNEAKRLPELLERSKYHLGQCAELGAMPNLGFLRGRHDNRPDSLKRMAEGVRAYCEVASGMGVKVLLEPICRYEIDSIQTAAQGLELKAMAGNPENLSLLLDTFHMNIEEASIPGAISRSKDNIGHVHFVDNTRAVPGHGCMRLGEVLKDLMAAGYDGFLGMEAIPGSNPDEDARQGLLYARNLILECSGQG